MPRTVQKSPPLTGSFTRRHTWATSPLATGIKMVTGTYVGDGNPTLAVAGVGFQPKLLIIYVQKHNTYNFGAVYKTDKDGLFAKFHWSPAPSPSVYYETDHIISLDADGFTVGDGTGSFVAGNTCNLAETYTYIAFGGSGTSKIAAGTYTGDGNATQPIAGVGFQPKFMYIYWQQTAGWQQDFMMKSDQDGLNSIYVSLGTPYYYDADHIISLDVDGFTVGDGTGDPFGNQANILGRVMTYVAMR